MLQDAFGTTGGHFHPHKEKRETRRAFSPGHGAFISNISLLPTRTNIKQKTKSTAVSGKKKMPAHYKAAWLGKESPVERRDRTGELLGR